MDVYVPGSTGICPKEAVQVQKRLSQLVQIRAEVENVGLIAGADVSVSRYSKKGRAAVVILTYPALETVETSTFEADITFPYIPGLLSFREIPLLVKAWAKLKLKPDLVVVDGHGLAHPRRLGIASHFGLITGIATIGCAKTRLCGEFWEPAEEYGCVSPLSEGGEVIGMVVRTRPSVKPVFISPGHKIDFENSVKWTLNACRGFRLPEPIRRAHRAASVYN